MGPFFAFFLISGFCGLIYEVVWLRLAMASFGLNAPLVSTFLSVFMAGLGLGSWLAGAIVRKCRPRSSAFFLRAYACMELALGACALAVPYFFRKSEAALAASFSGASWGSLSYYALSGALITAALLPACTLMGATFPTAMAAIERLPGPERRRSFSFLYVANMTGAVLGTLCSAFVLIECLGLAGTLRAAAAANVLLAAGAGLCGFSPPGKLRAPSGDSGGSGSRRPLPLLFLTGAASMGMEVVWMRIYVRVLDNSVYAFAAILAVYLAATLAGSLAYRSAAEKADIREDGPAWAAAGLLGLLPLLASAPRSPSFSPGLSRGILLLAAGIAPFCGLIGFLTPKLVDEWSEGDPSRAGRAYAFNILGCLLGPLAAGFLLLPNCDEAWALLALALPLMAAGFALTILPSLQGPRRGGRKAAALTWTVLAASAILFAFGRRAGGRPPGAILRDYEATVTASGEARDKVLLVNGIGMTAMTPITKMMAHLPMALLAEPAANSLTICFGMGTTFRSFLSWGVQATAVDLVPSVPRLFGYFHEDAERLSRSPGALIVADDGRRFLKRTTSLYDVIVIDPPPPIHSSYSSLLYSREFYALAGARLKPGGILQQWIPGDVEPEVAVSIVKSLAESFPHVRVFRSLFGWGFHLLASRRPIPARRPAQMARLLPPAARRDLVEWGPFPTPEAQFEGILKSEMPLASFAKHFAKVPALSDDRPYNEYFLLRTAFPAVH